MISLVVVVALAVGFMLVRNFLDKRGQESQVGNCVVATGTSNDAELEEVDCETETGFHYKVALAVETVTGCPTPEYTTFETTRTRRGSESTVGVLCLMPIFQDGKCYGEDTSTPNEFAEVACDAGNALLRIEKILQENRPDQCSYPDNSIGYPEPATTYCLAPPQE